MAAHGDSRSTAPVVSTADASVLHHDLLYYEILVRLPVKPLCRLRAVCRSWRSLLSDSYFVLTHGARHGPLVAAFKQEPMGVDILDTSGNKVKSISFENCGPNCYENVACTNLDLFCVIDADQRPQVIDPATGAISLLPGFYHSSNLLTSFALGRASSTREAKLLAVTQERMETTSCKVLTLGAGGGAGEWRETGCPQTSLLVLPSSSSCVALVKGVLYFVDYDKCHDADAHIAAYDLETETWRPDLIHFPLPIKGGNSLAELSGSLVAVYDHNVDQKRDVFMELWFLTDPEKVLWSKQYTITMPDRGVLRPSYSYGDVQPLWALDDGKIVFSVSQYDRINVVHSLRVYDSGTNTYTDGAEMVGYDFLGVYNGSLLAGLPWIRI